MRSSVDSRKITGSPFFKVISLGENENFFALFRSHVVPGLHLLAARSSQSGFLVLRPTAQSRRPPRKVRRPINFLFFGPEIGKSNRN
jgi:hypothetical protein